MEWEKKEREIFRQCINSDRRWKGREKKAKQGVNKNDKAAICDHFQQITLVVAALWFSMFIYYTFLLLSANIFLHIRALSIAMISHGQNHWGWKTLYKSTFSWPEKHTHTHANPTRISSNQLSIYSIQNGLWGKLPTNSIHFTQQHFPIWNFTNFHIPKMMWTFAENAITKRIYILFVSHK